MYKFAFTVIAITVVFIIVVLAQDAEPIWRPQLLLVY